MTSLTLRAQGPASEDVVWERYVDPGQWSTWAPQIQRVSASTQRLVAGTTGTVHAGLLPRPTLSVAFEVLTLDEARHEWTWRAHVGPIGLRLEHGVRSRGDGTETWLRVHGPLPIVLAYAPVARLALSRLVRE